MIKINAIYSIDVSNFFSSIVHLQVIGVFAVRYTAY